jgi:hypothetical protein
MRRIVLSLSSILAMAVAYLTAAPAAFAMRLTPPSGGATSVTASNVAHHAGLAWWEISLIVVAAVLLAITVLATAIRSSRRSVPTAAVG